MSHGSSLNVGDKLYGFCHGIFGRDSYGTKTVIAIGPDWVLLSEMSKVGRYPDCKDCRWLHAYSGDPDDLTEYTTRPDEDGDY